MSTSPNVFAVALAAAVTCSSLVDAKDATAADHYPSRPIALVVAGAPSGGTDAIARLLAHEFSKDLGQSVVVENRAGAGGIIGTKHVANSPPDGYTFLLGHIATNAIVPALIRPRPYDPIADFTPIGMVGSSADVLVVRTDSGVTNVKDLLATASEQKPVYYGSPGVGLPQHISGFALAKASGAHMQHVPYRGSGPALQDLVGGRLNTMFVTPGAVIPYLDSKELAPLAVTSPTRSRFLPDVPTIAEAGFPSVERTGWFGMFAPRDTPAPIVQKISTLLGETLAKPEVRAKLEGLYLEPATDTSAETFAKVVQRDAAKWEETIERLGVTAE